MKALHLRTTDHENRVATACGNSGKGYLLTTIVSRVTCKNCLRSIRSDHVQRVHFYHPDLLDVTLCGWNTTAKKTTKKEKVTCKTCTTLLIPDGVLKKGTLRCPVHKTPLHWKQVQGMRLIEDGQLEGACLDCNHHYFVRA